MLLYLRLSQRSPPRDALRSLSRLRWRVGVGAGLLRWLSHRHLAVPHRRAGGDGFGGVDDGVGVDAVVAIEIVDGAGLPEMLDAERFDLVAAHAAEPAEGRRVTVDHGDDAAIARQWRQQLLDMAEMRYAAAIAAQFSRRGPPRMQAVGGCDREQADIAAAFADQADRLDRFGRNGAGIGDHRFAILAGPAQPIGAIGDALDRKSTRLNSSHVEI